ncbi:MAG: hypothetical protein HOC20_13520 [Chloroflexi bacterium]|nr:hypothetical protein [Chloroflexota bacterium]
MVLKISKVQVKDLMQRIEDSADLESCGKEVKKMLAIKSRLALESHVGC